MFWIKSVPLFHVGSSAFSSLFVKIKFTLTFQPTFILLMCVSMRWVTVCLRTVHHRLCAAVSALRACAQESEWEVFFSFLEECMSWGHYHVRCDDGACFVTADRAVASLS